MNKPYMDNNRLIVVSATREDFDLAMNLAFRHHSKCVGWSFYSPKRGGGLSSSWQSSNRPEELLGVTSSDFLVLHWYKSESDKRVNLFPMELDCALASSFAWDWLNKQDFKNEPDHDGSNHKGFVVFNEVWGHVGGDSSAIIAVGPAWAMAGK